MESKGFVSAHSSNGAKCNGGGSNGANNGEISRGRTSTSLERGSSGPAQPTQSINAGVSIQPNTEPKWTFGAGQQSLEASQTFKVQLGTPRSSGISKRREGRGRMRLKEKVRSNNFGSNHDTTCGDSDPSKNPKRSLAVRDVDYYPIGFGCQQSEDVQKEAHPIDDNGSTGCGEFEGFSKAHEATTYA